MKIKRLTASFIISAMVIGTVGCSDKIELSNDSYENDSTDQVTEDLSATEEAEEFSFTQNYSGDKYVVINLGGDKPMVYYKTYEPVVIH